jgi:TonB family protein
MTEVTNVIVARRNQPERMNPMVLGSLVAHAAIVTALVMGGPLFGRSSEPPRTVMTISLGGSPGPVAGGMTPEAGRAIPEPPKEPARKVETPPPPTPPKMTLPERNARVRPRPKPTTTEEEPRPGSTRTETRARGTGFGLSSGGGGGTGVQLDVANFCCPEYLQQMTQLIQRNWQQNQGVVGSTLMKFTITRAGSIEGVMVERPSGFIALDLAAQRALLLTRLPDLPPQFPNPSLTVHVTFEYQR